MEKEHQRALTKMLNLKSDGPEGYEYATWPEIYEAIGKLKERAGQPPQITKQ